MHILFIPFTYPSDYNINSGIFFEEQAKALRVNGNKVNVMALVGISIRSILNKKIFKLGFESYARNGISVFMYSYLSIPKYPRLNNLIRLSIGKKIFKKYIDENGLPDLLHVHVASSGEIALWVKREYNIPYVITEHSSAFLVDSPEPLWMTKLLDRVYQNASAVISVSYNLKKNLYNKFKVESVVIPNTVDTAYFSLKTNKKSNGYVFLNIANFTKNKNQEMLILAFKEAYKGDLSYKLIIAGGGTQKRQLKCLIDKYSLSKQVTLLDLVSREDVRNLIGISDCLLLTSYKETFGVVLIEAMSSGLPLISTRSGGPEDIIKNNRLGLLCNTNVKSIKEAIKKIPTIKFDVLYIRQNAIENYSHSVFSSSIMTLYRKVIDGERNK